jgi:hypothetical protein
MNCDKRSMNCDNASMNYRARFVPLRTTWRRHSCLPRLSSPASGSVRAAAVLAALCLAAGAGAQTGFPFQDESLHYTINYTSGLSLGDSNLSAHKTSAGWDFTVTLDAAVAGVNIKDKYTSSMIEGYCSKDLRREISHGSKTTIEKTVFDQEKQTAHRQTDYPSDGGSSDLSTGACARDAISFLYFARKELGQGRVPPAQVVYFGSSYSVRQSYTGAQTITLADKKPEVTDHLEFSVKGPRAEFSVEVYFARDAARTPLLVKIPLAAGALSMELVR